MKFLRNNIPNAITAANLFCGLVAIYLAFHNLLAEAAFFIIAAAVLDFFDGMTARLLKSDTKIGKDLDSLADVVSFGAAPAFIIIHLKDYFISLNESGLYTKAHFEFFYQETVMVFAFIIAVFSAVRLAIFNNDTRQTTSFIGVPTPANALFIISFALIAKYQPNYFPIGIIENKWLLGGICLFLPIIDAKICLVNHCGFEKHSRIVYAKLTNSFYQLIFDQKKTQWFCIKNMFKC